MPIDADSISGIKKSLYGIEPDELRGIILRMAKYRKENKELLSYLLYHQHDERQYIADVKHELDLMFKSINKGTVYLTGKGLRKVLKFATKQIRFSADKRVEAEILLHYCGLLLKHVPGYSQSTVLFNIYQRQLLKAQKAISQLHPELQSDLAEELKLLLK